MKRRKVFDAVITDLISIGSLFEYLVNHWHKNQLIVSIWQDNIRKPQQMMTDYNACDKLYRYLLTNWAEHKIKVVMYEDNNPSS